MSIVVITGSAGLVGSETARFFAAKGLDIVGIDNDMRGYFFGPEASTAWNRERLCRELPGYRHANIDIRDAKAIFDLFAELGSAIVLVVHCAAQPSHDWAAREPATDFSVNATGTLTLLEATRQYCPGAPFIFTSTNKVYGDTPNRLPLVERDTRFELPAAHPYGAYGVDESMSLDGSLHSLFGASKLAADVLVQEYGRSFGLATVCFRGGCLTGPNHSGTAQHGFLSYLMRCALTGEPYTVLGYQGKQVRDNIHAYDLVGMFWQYFRRPRPGAVYNAGGGRFSNCSLLEAIALCEKLTGKPLHWRYSAQNRLGDHRWWISDTRRFQADYPEWRQSYDILRILEEIRDGLGRRLRGTAA